MARQREKRTGKPTKQQQKQQEDDAKLPLTSYQTALAILPPKDICEGVDEIRSHYDSVYHRWPAHINIFYPFVSQENLPEAADLISCALRDRSKKVRKLHREDGSLALRLDRVECVKKTHKEALVHLVPDGSFEKEQEEEEDGKEDSEDRGRDNDGNEEVENEHDGRSGSSRDTALASSTAQLNSLRNFLLPLFGRAHAGFSPRLVLGQGYLGGDDKERPSFEDLRFLAEQLGPLQWSATDLVLLSRRKFKKNEDNVERDHEKILPWATINIATGDVTYEQEDGKTPEQPLPDSGEQPTRKLRPAWDLITKFQNDPNLKGRYLIKCNGPSRYAEYTSKNPDSTYFTPEHRIRQIRAWDGGRWTLVWDRARKIDLVFRSGNTISRPPYSYTQGHVDTTQLDKSATKLRPALDVIHRLKHDPLYRDECYVVAFHDIRTGNRVRSAREWVEDTSSTQFIPQHRIFQILEIRRDKWYVAWDREGRIDHIFGSGKGLAARRHNVEAVKPQDIEEVLPE
ncbi:hypothetical protein KEM55_004557 [Ascosphaera atra]|nr:hypothetical protein KEM55_004557 [Ascosphaera atra]